MVWEFSVNKDAYTLSCFHLPQNENDIKMTAFWFNYHISCYYTYNMNLEQVIL